MYALVLIYGIISIFLGIGPVLIITFKKYGVNRSAWGAWILGGLFWFLAFMIRLPLLQLIAVSPGLREFNLVLAPLLAGLFETAFRALVLLIFTKHAGSTKEKVIMTGLGWGTGEAIYVHAIQIGAIIFFPALFPEIIASLDGLEWTLVFGGYERIITEVFHLFTFILVFYGIKDKLKINQSKANYKTFFTRDPNPPWAWIFIVAGVHFLYDFVLIVMFYTMGIIILYMVGTILVGILASYTTNRMKHYPLFPENDVEKKKEDLKKD